MHLQLFVLLFTISFQLFSPLVASFLLLLIGSYVLAGLSAAGSVATVVLSHLLLQMFVVAFTIAPSDASCTLSISFSCFFLLFFDYCAILLSCNENEYS